MESQAQAYRDAIDAVQAANARYISLANEMARTGPLASTIEERQKQYQQWAARKAQGTRELMHARESLNTACIARDAAFAALKGN